MKRGPIYRRASKADQTGTCDTGLQPRQQFTAATARMRRPIPDIWCSNRGGGAANPTGMKVTSNEAAAIPKQVLGRFPSLIA